MFELHHGDCLEVMAGMDAGSVDAVVCDPPAGIAFMNKSWDRDKGGRKQWIAWMTDVARECLRVIKPGGHALVWAIPRTSHWTGTAWEDAGWEPRDTILHAFGSGFPKSSRINRDPRFCQCADVERNELNIDHEPTLGVHMGTGAAFSGNAPQQKDAPHLKHKLVSSPDGCQQGHGLHGEPVPFGQAASLEFPPLQEHAQEHSRLLLPGDDGDCESLHNLSGVQCTGLLSNQDCFPQTDSFSAKHCGTQVSKEVLENNSTLTNNATSVSHKSRKAFQSLAYPCPPADKYRPKDSTCQVCGKPMANGWGSALKPAVEIWWLFRKPVEGTIAENVLKHGTGGLNVGACRVGMAEGDKKGEGGRDKPEHCGVRIGNQVYNDGWKREMRNDTIGRFPANLIHDGSPEVVALFPVTGPSSGRPRHNNEFKSVAKGRDLPHTAFGHDDNGGSAARFFYCAKASKTDRSEGNNHPTVKPTSLMQYLCRLVTPPNGIILDPFMGSGSTGKAAMLEGFRFVGIEQNPDYIAIAQARISAAYTKPKHIPLFTEGDRAHVI